MQINSIDNSNGANGDHLIKMQSSLMRYQVA